MFHSARTIHARIRALRSAKNNFGLVQTLMATLMLVTLR